jgi:ribosomal protein S18 acetylase RimI-like enzyme
MIHIVPDRALVFRPGRPPDARAMAELGARCDAADSSWAPPGWAPAPNQVDQDTEWIAAQLADDEDWVLIAERGDRLIGFAMVRPGSTPGRGQLSNLFVDPSCQCNGIGSTLLAHVVEAIRRRGWEEAELSCQVGNSRARALYERTGWRDTGARHTHTAGLEMAQYVLALSP